MQKKKNKKTKHKTKNIIKILIFSITFVILIFVLLKSEYFSIKKVIVTNNKFISSEEIKALAQINNTNIFLINKNQINKNIITEPYVESTEISRILPDTIKISVKEKKICGLFKFQGSYINIDTKGRMVHIVNQFPNGKIPLIYGETLSQYTPGKNIFTNKLRQQALIELLTINDYCEYKDLIFSINLTNPYDIILKTVNGLEIRLGDWTNLNYKLSYASSIIKNPKIKGKKGYIEIEDTGIAVFKQK